MMSHELTPAAQRALAFAAQWRRRRAPDTAGNDDLGPVELLLGLLGEPECRAALLATARGIDVAAVRTRWPQVESASSETLAWQDRLSVEVREALQIAEAHLFDYPPPHVLSTEHLLLGLATGGNEVGQWLATKGWDAELLAVEIDRLAGYSREPLPLELDLPAGKTDATPSRPSALLPDGAEMSSSEVAITESDQIARLRILDAAANRAGEAVRVIEDYARFVLDDRHLAGQCKSLRHDLTNALSVFSAAERHAARETRQDVGTTISLKTELERADLRAVVGANFKRLEQALRSLEEYAKGSTASAARALEQLRYRVYTLERAVGITADSIALLTTCRLYVLIDGRDTAEALAQWVDMLMTAGVDAIQLRDKSLSDRELLARARAIRGQTRGTGTLFIMNDRPDMARLSGADGVHVGQDELTVKEARAIVGPHALIGVSTHSLDQAKEAVLNGANYIGVGPVFPSRTKQFAQFPGLDLLRAVGAEIRLPAFAIGGITAENIGEVRACGFDRVAVSSAVTASSAPADAARELKMRLG
jgi:thiamine-phosphate pyrophosphorylase